jgi:hypothetical protein
MSGSFLALPTSPVCAIADAASMERRHASPAALIGIIIIADFLLLERNFHLGAALRVEPPLPTDSDFSSVWKTLRRQREMEKVQCMKGMFGTCGGDGRPV